MHSIHLILVSIPSSLILFVNDRGWSGGVLLNRQNLLSMTKVICRWSLNSNEPFQTSHDYESENMNHRQNFGENLLKTS